MNNLLISKIYNILFENDYLTVLFNRLNDDKKQIYRYIINETIETIDYRKIPLIFDNTNKENKNIMFYKGSIHALGTSNRYFTDIIKYNDVQLESGHSYIQWLFPNRTQSKYNKESVTLQQEEINVFKTNKEIKNKIIASITLMLKFYGFHIKNDIILPHDKSDERFNNLIKNPHNNLRISRILYFLGDLDMIYYQYRFLYALYYEIFITEKLEKLKSSFIQYWIHSIKDDNQRNDFKIIVLQTIISKK